MSKAELILFHSASWNICYISDKQICENPEIIRELQKSLRWGIHLSKQGDYCVIPVKKKVGKFDTSNQAY